MDGLSFPLSTSEILYGAAVIPILVGIIVAAAWVVDNNDDRRATNAGFTRKVCGGCLFLAVILVLGSELVKYL